MDIAGNYPYVVDNILLPRETRKEFFLEIINPQVPTSSGYKRMAELMARKYVWTIFTTNFDRILPKFCDENRRPHHVDVIQTRSDFTTISTRPQHPQIIYLHGSISHYSDKNSLAEIAHLDKDLVAAILPLLKDHPLIVIGYRGAEPSVMKHLLIDHADGLGGYRHGIYWCARNYDAEDPNNLTPFVHELADKIGGNFQIVPVEGFDEVMEELWEHVRDQQPKSDQMRATADPEESTSPSYDLQLVRESSLNDFEWATLRTRLLQYCEKMAIPVPPFVDDNWVIYGLCNQHLALPTKDNNIVPTVGGYLLFAAKPQNHVRSAQVIVRVGGSPEWLEKVFNNSGDDDGIMGDHVERIIEGNLSSQLDAIYDILSLVNQPFRLKGEVSTPVQPYPPAALREMVVNALVHRNYAQSEPIVY